MLRRLMAVGLISLSLLPVAAQAAIHPGDKLSVRVYEQPDLSTQVTVDGSGHISVPLIGDLQAAGVEPADLALAIQSRLTRFVRYPAVSVTYVARTDIVFVRGGTTATVAYVPGLSLDGAVSSLSLRPGTDLRRVALIRDGRTLGTFDLTGKANAPALEGGDTIAFDPRPIAVKVSGAVKNPGTVHLDDGESMAAALAAAGGASDAAAYSGLTVQRDGASLPQTNLRGLDGIAAQGGDILFVPSAPHVAVLGMVERAGQVTLHEDSSLLAALYLGGGPNNWGDLKNVKVRRNGTERRYDITALTHGDTRQNPELQDGDVVFVPEGNRIDFRSIFTTLVLGRVLTR